MAVRRRCSSRFIGAARVAVGLAFGATLGVAHADQDDTFNLIGGVGYTHDDNVVRLPGHIEPEDRGADHNRRSDDIRSVTVGFDFDKPISQQRLRANASATRNDYQTHDEFSHTAKNYLLAWDWAFTPRLTGTLSADQRQSLVDFAYYRDLAHRNMRTVRRQEFEADWWVHSSWHVLGGLAHEDFDNDRATVEEPGQTARRFDFGFRFDPGNERTVTGMVRHRRGEQQDTSLVDVEANNDDFDENEYEVAVDYAFGGKSRLRTTLGYLDRDYDHDDQGSDRDFDGWYGEARWDWKATEKLGCYAGFERQLKPWQVGAGSSARQDVWSAGTRWDFTVRQSLDLRYEFRNREQRGRIAAGDLRDDDTQALRLGWRWEPIRTAEINLSYEYETRDSNADGNDLDYHANVFAFTAQIMF